MGLYKGSAGKSEAHPKGMGIESRGAFTPWYTSPTGTRARLRKGPTRRWALHGQGPFLVLSQHLSKARREQG